MSFLVAGAVIGVGAGVGGYLSSRRAQRKAESQESRARGQMEKYRESYSGMDITNPYANMQNQFTGMQNPYENMENVYEDLTVDTRASEFEAQQFGQSQANILGDLRGTAGPSGIAALAQTLSNQGALQAQRSSASIGQQESANQRMMAQEAGRLQGLEARTGLDIDLKTRSEAARIDMQGAQGEIQRQQREEQRASDLMRMYGGETAGYGQQATQAEQSKFSALGGIGQSLIGLSDRRFKKNINLIGKSPSGLKIYTFEYINETLGKGVYQGVMSDEIPSSAVVTKNGCDFVDYSKIDVKFKNVN
tara:strand:+ start:6119 stop:7036 length:918 start_codon:yes stop_codon:yes gene_type:complete